VDLNEKIGKGRAVDTLEPEVFLEFSSFREMARKFFFSALCGSLAACGENSREEKSQEKTAGTRVDCFVGTQNILKYLHFLHYGCYAVPILYISA